MSSGGVESPRTALLVGAAACMAEDRAAAGAMFGDAGPDTTIFCNHPARDEDGPVDHWVTMHPELLGAWLKARQVAGRPAPGTFWCPSGRPVPVNIPFRRAPSWGGSSGLLMVTVALELGCSRIVLAGVPLDKQPHYDDARAWRDGPRYRYAWTGNADKLRSRVRSMSGWTRDLLGSPSADWLSAKD